MIRTVWALALVVGFAGTGLADPPRGHGGRGYGGQGGGTIHLGTPIHAGGGQSHGGFGVGVGGYGGGGLSIGFSNGRGFGIGITIPAYNPAPRYYPAPIQPIYPPVQYTRSSIIYRSPAYAPGGVYDLPPLSISNPLAAPQPFVPQPPATPSAIPPATPIGQPPGTFPYDGGPANPIPLPAPDANPPAPVKPPSDGVKVSLPGRPVAKPGYGFPAYTPK